MIVLDTSILVYAVGTEHPLRDPCRRVFAAQRARSIDAAVTVEVVQEFTYIRARTWPRRDAASVARDYAASLRLLQATVVDLERGLEIFETTPRLGMFDSIVAAVALNQGADALLSADGGFGDVAGLRWIDPASSELDAVLGSLENETIDLVVDRTRPDRTHE